MTTEEIKNFVNNLKDKNNKIPIDRVLLLNNDELYRIVYSTNKTDILNSLGDTLKTLFFIVNDKTSFLLGNRDIAIVLKLLDAFESAEYFLFSNRIISERDYLNLKSKHIYSLAEMNFVLDSIHKTFTVANLLSDRIKEIKDRDEKKYIHLSLRKIYIYMRHKCSQNNFYNYSNTFHYKSKTEELFLLFYLYKISPSDNELLNHSQVYRRGNFWHELFIDDSHDTGFKKIKFYLKIMLSIIFNLFSRFFWGYSEKILLVVFNSFLIISIYALFIYFSIIKIFCQHCDKIDLSTSYYFSIVTFTSLGYGDIKPNFDGFSQNAMAFEALLGILCISLIIFMIGKKTRY